VGCGFGAWIAQPILLHRQDENAESAESAGSAESAA